MSLSQIRNRIYALHRKYALPLAIMRARRHADAYCNDWDAAIDQNQTPPGGLQFIQKLRQDGLQRPGLNNLYRYLTRCYDAKTRPEPNEIAKRLFPYPKYRRIQKILPWPKPLKPETISFKNQPPHLLIRIEQLEADLAAQAQPRRGNPRGCPRPACDHPRPTPGNANPTGRPRPAPRRGNPRGCPRPACACHCHPDLPARDQRQGCPRPDCACHCHNDNPHPPPPPMPP